MGMPVTVEVVDPFATQSLLGAVFRYLEYVDAKFSTYSDQSEISQINRGELSLEDASDDMRAVFALAERTRLETDGYFDILHDGAYDPSGVVKGWAILRAANILREAGAANYYVDAGGDIQMSGQNSEGQPWRVGIRNPFNPTQIIKALSLTGCGVATSGTYARGGHIYNPMDDGDALADVASLTVIGPDVCEADRFATAAFAMGKHGIFFIEALQGFEAYMVDQDRRATFTTGFERYLLHDPIH
jgi:thiamine biosynthesis lipoprotein